MNLVHGTPIECHEVKGQLVYVKREDLAAPYPGPPFSKVRGLMPVLERMKKEGKVAAGYTETSVSMAGWGVAWGCALLGLRAIIFDPQYKETPPLLAYHRERWNELGAEVRPIQAGMAKVNWNISRNRLAKEFGDKADLLPLGLRFPETISATEEEARLVLQSSVPDFRSVVVNIGSGTIAAGIGRVFKDATIYGIMGRTGNMMRTLHNITQKGGLVVGGFTGQDFRLVDPGWWYSQRSEQPCPFPCHPWYDLKAWQWLVENIEKLKPPILFWNIGNLPANFKEE